jgi:site-specific DNA-methyltransferase (adenine-specific)
MCNFKRWLVSFCDYHHCIRFEEHPPRYCRSIRMGIWVKPNSAPQFSGDRPGMGWEAISIMHHDGEGRMHWNGGGRHAVWIEPRETRSDHPAAKPLPLLTQFVKLFTDPGETILDPFMGSGTTLRAAKASGRKAIGIERDEKWCEYAAEWMKQAVLPFDAAPRRAPVNEALSFGGEDIENAGAVEVEFRTANGDEESIMAMVEGIQDGDDGGPLGDD